MLKWYVYLNGKHIDTVMYLAGQNASDVRRSLISHDHFDSQIVVSNQPPTDEQSVGYVPPVDLPERVIDCIVRSAGLHCDDRAGIYRFAEQLKEEIIARLPLHCFVDPKKKV